MRISGELSFFVRPQGSLNPARNILVIKAGLTFQRPFPREKSYQNVVYDAFEFLTAAVLCQNPVGYPFQGFRAIF